MTALFGRMRLLGLGLLAATFIAGALAGAAMDRVLTPGEPDRVERGRDADREGGHRRSYVIDQIDMSDGQRGEIDEILEERAARMKAVWKEVSPRLEAITDSARMEIMAVLTPEQRAEYERKLRERHGRR